MLKAQKVDPETIQFYKLNMSNLESLIGPQFCSLCDRNIGQSVKIRSADRETLGSALVVCLECLRTGMTISNSTSGQETIGKYIVLDNLKFPMFSKDWSAKEELLLLQGIMKCGMGNWMDISEQYIKTKSAEECEEHYFTFYYKSKENNLPVEDDCIIKGPRKLKKGPEGHDEIEIQID